MDYQGKEHLPLFQGLTPVPLPFIAFTTKIQGALAPPECGKEGPSAWAG